MTTIIGESTQQNNPLISGDYYMPSIFVNLLRSHFSGDPNKRIPALRSVTYVQQIAQGAVADKLHHIKIQKWDEFDPSATNITPCVIAKDNDAQSARIGMGDRHMAPISNPNTDTYSRAWASSVTLYIIAEKPALVKLLAWEVANVIEASLPPLREQLDMHRMELRSIGAVKPIKEFPKNFAAVVSVEYTFIRSWEITPAVPTLNHVVVDNGF